MRVIFFPHICRTFFHTLIWIEKPHLWDTYHKAEGLTKVFLGCSQSMLQESPISFRTEQKTLKQHFKRNKSCRMYYPKMNLT